jgi:Icc-related predicted phosphoesterase
MKILFTSDLHGNLEAFSRFSELLDRDEFDLGIISGDLMTYNPEKEAIEKKTKKILEMPGKKILFIMGNDDGILDHNWDDTEFLINPDLKKIELYNFTFVGYQYTNPYVGGPFEKTEEEQMKDMPLLESLIDSNTIFISHGPAYGILDKAYNNQNVGSQALLGLVSKTKPAFHLFGHIHQSVGVSGTSINGAYPNIRKFFAIDTETKTIENIE